MRYNQTARLRENSIRLNNQIGIFNLCNEDTLSVLEVANIIMKILGEKKIVWLDNNWKGDNSKLEISNDKLSQFYTIQLSSAQAIKKATNESI